MKRLNVFLAGALVALVYGSSRAFEEHVGVADPLHVPEVLAAASAPTVADRCDMEKIKANAEEHNRKMVELWRPRLPKNNLEKPKLIIYPLDSTARSWDFLCKSRPESIWNLIDKQGKRAEFNQAQSIDDQVKLIGEAVKQWKEVDVKIAGIRAKTEEIAAKSKEYAGSIDKQKKESSLGAAKQKELLAQLISANGEKLLGASALHAPAGKSWATGGELFNGKEGLYEQMKGLAANPVISANIPAGWKIRMEGKQDNEGQGFNRQMMRVLWRPKGEANPDKLASSVLEILDPDSGNVLRDSFYAARTALNDMNQAVISLYGPQPGALDRAALALEGRVSQEKLAALERERKIRDVEQNVARKTAEQIFDRSGRNRGDIKVDEMDAMVNTVRGKMATGENAITFTAKGKDDKTNTRDMPLPSGEADPKIIEEAKGIAELLMQDKDVQANLAAAGLALKGDVVVNEDASGDKENLTGKKGDLSADLETPKDGADTLRDMAKKSGPGCTKNSMENLKASEEDKIGNMASGRIKDRTNALKDLNKAETTADKALKEAESKADDVYKACKAKLDSRRDSRTIGPAKYNEGLAACAQARDGSKSSALGDFNKAMSEANSTYKGKVAKAGTEKQISKWEKDTTGKLNDEVVEAYNREIRENQGALVSKFGSESGRIELGRSYASKKGQLSEDVPEEFVADYIKARWGNPPAALKDCREYIVKKNAEADAGMNRFVKEEDFPKWYDGRKGDISKEWGGDGKKEPAKKEPVKPGEKVKKIDPKAVDEELEKQP